MAILEDKWYLVDGQHRLEMIKELNDCHDYIIIVWYKVKNTNMTLIKPIKIDIVLLYCLYLRIYIAILPLL